MASNVSQPSYFHVLLLAFVILHSLPQAKSCANHTLDATFSQLHLPEGCYGPSTISFDHKGEGPYIGSVDGRIFKYHDDTSQFKEYCVGNVHRYLILLPFLYQVLFFCTELIYETRHSGDGEVHVYAETRTIHILLQKNEHMLDYTARMAHRSLIGLPAICGCYQLLISLNTFYRTALLN